MLSHNYREKSFIKLLLSSCYVPVSLLILYPFNWAQVYVVPGKIICIYFMQTEAISANGPFWVVGIMNNA